MSDSIDDIFARAERINAGIQKAVRKLIERKAALNGSLVVEDGDSFKTVPAKDLLRDLNEKDAKKG